MVWILEGCAFICQWRQLYKHYVRLFRPYISFEYCPIYSFLHRQLSILRSSSLVCFFLIPQLSSILICLFICFCFLLTRSCKHYISCWLNAVHPLFQWGLCCYFVFLFCVVFCMSFGHCTVSPSIYCFWLWFCYLKAFLEIITLCFLP